MQKWNWQYTSAKLPVRLSEFSVVQGLAPDEEGDLHTLVYLMGGCSDEVRSSNAGDVNNNNFSSDDIPCWDVSPYTFTYDPKRNIFAKRANALRKRYRHGAVTIGGNIWVLGGLDGTKEWVKEVDMYDPGTDRWLYIGDLPTEFKVSDFAIYAAANGEHVYVMGGYNDALMAGGGVASSMAYKLNVQQTLDRYHRDPSSAQKQQTLVLSKISNLNDKRANINAVSFSHYIYVAGGYTTTATAATTDNSRCKQPLDTVERYDMTNDTWRYVAMLHTAKANVGLIRYGDVFVAVGGDTSTPTPSSSAGCLGGIATTAVNNMEIYSPLDGPRATWTNIPISPMDGRMHYVAFPWKETESILIFGGIIKGPEGCNCYFSSDKVLVYSSLDEKVMHYQDSHWFVMFSALAILSIISLAVTLLRHRRRKKRNRSADDTSETMGIVMATHDVT